MKIMNNKATKLFLIIFIVGILIVAIQFFVFRKMGGQVIVSLDGETIGSYDLNKNQILLLENEYGSNTLEIRDGKANMIDADCPDKLCVSQSEISYQNESIICLPHHLIITVEGQPEAELDGVTR